MTAQDNLQSFIERVQLMRDGLKSGNDTFALEFQELKLKSARYKLEKSSKIGELECNTRKNRYRDILPFDETRVKLDNQGPDYINANFVTGVDDAAKVYIASQAPLPNTVVDFWRMMWHYKVEIIVMACKTVENGKAKCEKYWPELDDEKVFGLFTITLASEKRLSQNVVVREICARKGDEQRKFTQFHYQAWPDHGIPSSSLPIINMIKAFRKLQPHDNIPIVIHCSAGCGRTGAIIVLDLVMKLLEMEKIEETFDLFNLIDNMRRQRPAIVQTRDQYEFVHLAVSELMIEEIKSKHQNLTGHTYENIQCENPKKHEVPGRNTIKQLDVFPAPQKDEKPVPAMRGTKQTREKPIIPPKAKSFDENLSDDSGMTYQRVRPGMVSSVKDQLLAKLNNEQPLANNKPLNQHPKDENPYEEVQMKDNKEKQTKFTQQEESGERKNPDIRRIAAELSALHGRIPPSGGTQKKEAAYEEIKKGGDNNDDEDDDDNNDDDDDDDDNIQYAVVNMSRKSTKFTAPRSVSTGDEDLPPALPDRTKESKQFIGDNDDEETVSIASNDSSNMEHGGGTHILDKMKGAFGKLKMPGKKKSDATGTSNCDVKRQEAIVPTRSFPDTTLLPTQIKPTEKEDLEEVIKNAQKKHIPTFNVKAPENHLGYPNRLFVLAGPREPPQRWKGRSAPIIKH